MQSLEKTTPTFNLICTMTEMSKSKKEWKGETVVIDQEMLSRHLDAPDLLECRTARHSMRKMLVSAGIDEDEYPNGRFCRLLKHVVARGEGAGPRRA